MLPLFPLNSLTVSSLQNNLEVYFVTENRKIAHNMDVIAYLTQLNNQTLQNNAKRINSNNFTNITTNLTNNLSPVDAITLEEMPVDAIPVEKKSPSKKRELEPYELMPMQAAKRRIDENKLIQRLKRASEQTASLLQTPIEARSDVLITKINAELKANGSHRPSGSDEDETFSLNKTAAINNYAVSAIPMDSVDANLTPPTNNSSQLPLLKPTLGLGRFSNVKTYELHDYRPLQRIFEKRLTSK